MATPRALERELAFFSAMRAEWLKHYAGKYALVSGDTLVDTYSTFAEAYSAGVEKFGADTFLVRQVLEQDPDQSAPALVVGALFACQG